MVTSRDEVLNSMAVNIGNMERLLLERFVKNTGYGGSYYVIQREKTTGDMIRRSKRHGESSTRDIARIVQEERSLGVGNLRRVGYV